jgi:hypothetical protein
MTDVNPYNYLVQNPYKYGGLYKNDVNLAHYKKGFLTHGQKKIRIGKKKGFPAGEKRIFLRKNVCGAVLGRGLKKRDPTGPASFCRY